jgi:hypothetical protein
VVIGNMFACSLFDKHALSSYADMAQYDNLARVLKFEVL